MQAGSNPAWSSPGTPHTYTHSPYVSHSLIDADVGAASMAQNAAQQAPLTTNGGIVVGPQPSGGSFAQAGPASATATPCPRPSSYAGHSICYGTDGLGGGSSLPIQMKTPPMVQARYRRSTGPQSPLSNSSASLTQLTALQSQLDEGGGAGAMHPTGVAESAPGYYYPAQAGRKLFRVPRNSSAVTLSQTATNNNNTNMVMNNGGGEYYGQQLQSQQQTGGANAVSSSGADMPVNYTAGGKLPIPALGNEPTQPFSGSAPSSYLAAGPATAASAPSQSPYLPISPTPRPAIGGSNVGETTGGGGGGGEMTVGQNGYCTAGGVQGPVPVGYGAMMAGDARGLAGSGSQSRLDSAAYGSQPSSPPVPASPLGGPPQSGGYWQAGFRPGPFVPRRHLSHNASQDRGAMYPRSYDEFRTQRSSPQQQRHPLHREASSVTNGHPALMGSFPSPGARPASFSGGLRGRNGGLHNGSYNNHHHHNNNNSSNNNNASSQLSSAPRTHDIRMGPQRGGNYHNGAEMASSASSRSSSSASSIRDNLPLCPNDDACTLINDRKHQRQYAHTCRLFPCYHAHIRRHAKLFRHTEDQIAHTEGLTTGKVSTHALTSVNFSSISPDAPSAYRIYVTHNDKSYEIFGDWANVRVHTFKRYLHQVCHVTPQAQVLVLMKTQKVMDDDISSVKAYGVEQDSVIQLNMDTEAESPHISFDDL